MKIPEYYKTALKSKVNILAIVAIILGSCFDVVVIPYGLMVLGYMGYMEYLKLLLNKK